MLLLAKATTEHAIINHGELEIAIEDVRMAMQDCGAITPEKVLEDQLYEGEEDTRGVDAFLEWVTGAANKEIRRIALEGGDDGREDFLIGLSTDR
jgi:transcription initiation factor TFIID subunit 3